MKLTFPKSPSGGVRIAGFAESFRTYVAELIFLVIKNYKDCGALLVAYRLDRGHLIFLVCL